MITTQLIQAWFIYLSLKLAYNEYLYYYRSLIRKCLNYISIAICRNMYLLKYFRKLYSVFLYIKITLYYIEEKKLRRKQQNLLKK